VLGKNPGDITLLLRRMGAGDGSAREALFDLIYAELHTQAARLMRDQGREHTLQASALVNEAYLRLVNLKDPEWESRRHFFAVACKAMRSVLADHARAKRTGKRGGGAAAVPLDALTVPFERRAGDLLDLDGALREFAEIDARAAEVVELRFFAGLTCREIAQMLGISVGTVERDWEIARAWLYARLA
jgi:RNA polymerase sigma factor (TIGR02999 family)